MPQNLPGDFVVADGIDEGFGFFRHVLQFFLRVREALPFFFDGRQRRVDGGKAAIALPSRSASRASLRNFARTDTYVGSAL